MFGHLPPLDEWDDPDPDDYDHALGLVEGRLAESVIVAASTDISRPGAYGECFPAFPPIEVAADQSGD